MNQFTTFSFPFLFFHICSSFSSISLFPFASVQPLLSFISLLQSYPLWLLFGLLFLILLVHLYLSVFSLFFLISLFLLFLLQKWGKQLCIYAYSCNVIGWIRWIFSSSNIILYYFFSPPHHKLICWLDLLVKREHFIEILHYLLTLSLKCLFGIEDLVHIDPYLPSPKLLLYHKSKHRNDLWGHPPLTHFCADSWSVLQSLLYSLDKLSYS